MFDYLKKKKQLNLKRQSQQTHFLKSKDVLSGFPSKVEIRDLNITGGNIAVLTNQVLRSPLMVDWACKKSSNNQSKSLLIFPCCLTQKTLCLLGGAVAQKVERATPGENILGSIPAVTAPLPSGWVSVSIM